QWAVDDIEHPTEAGDELTTVFDLGVALHQAFQKVAELPDAADDRAENGAFPPRQAEIPTGIDPNRADGTDRGRRQAAEEQTLPSLAGTEPRDQLPPPQRPAAEKGADVGELDAQQDHQDQHGRAAD